jgi:hypothetical protein
VNMAFLSCCSCGSRFVRIDDPCNLDVKAAVCQSCGCTAQAGSYQELVKRWLSRDYFIDPVPVDQRTSEEELQRRYCRPVLSLSDVIGVKAEIDAHDEACVVSPAPEPVSAQGAFDFISDCLNAPSFGGAL